MFPRRLCERSQMFPGVSPSCVWPVILSPLFCMRTSQTLRPQHTNHTVPQGGNVLRYLMDG